MSRPREVRAAQREAPKRHPEMFDQDEDEDEVDPYHGDAYHTSPGIANFLGTAQPPMRKKDGAQ